MKTYRRIVELGSFRAAATDRGLSNAAVSKQLMELEAELGASLIARTTRRLATTEAGQAYSSGACRSLTTSPSPRPR
jgi:DNA-binding transcriptional LysR family regulator